jgi:hypothetical protein
MLCAACGVMFAALGPLTTSKSGASEPPIPGRWALRFNDEFTRLDAGWVQRYWWNGDTFWPTNERQVYRPTNVTVNGELELTARREPGLRNFAGSPKNSVGEQFCCSSGLLSSGGIRDAMPHGYAFTYGYVEARIRVPRGWGTWAAFWMLPANYKDSTEIDVMEVLGREPKLLYMHYRSQKEKYGRSYAEASPLSAGWHTYGLHWEPGSLTWYLDGAPRFSHTGSDVASDPHYIMFSLAIGGSRSWSGAVDDSTPFPSSMRIDWVRVWQRF